MADFKRLTSEQRTNLVAYLDGELDEGEVREIETVLAQSTIARTDVEGLARTYEMLDLLERPKASVDFTEKTLATVQLEQVKGDVRDTRWEKYSRLLLIFGGWTIGLLGVTSVAFLATNQWMPRPEDELLRELPVIEELDAFAEVDNVVFLQRLARQTALLNEMRELATEEEGH